MAIHFRRFYASVLHAAASVLLRRTHPFNSTMKLHSRFTNTGFMLQPRCVWSSFFEKYSHKSCICSTPLQSMHACWRGWVPNAFSRTPTPHVVSKYKYRMHTSSTITWAWRDAWWRLYRSTLWRHVAGNRTYLINTSSRAARISYLRACCMAYS